MEPLTNINNDTKILLNRLLTNIKNTIDDRRYYNDRSTLCDTLIDNVVSYYSNGGVLPSRTINDVCYKLIENGGIRYSDVILNSIVRFVRQLKQYKPNYPSVFVFNILSTDHNLFDCLYFSDVIDYNFILENGDVRLYNDELDYIFFKRGVILKITDRETKTCLNNIDKTNSIILYKILNSPSIEIDKKSALQMIELHSIELFKLIIMKGYEINNDLLEYIITKKSKYKKDKILFLLDNKIIPTEQTFNNLVNTHIETYRHYKSYKSFTDNDNTDIVNMIINYGYIPTYENVKNALKKKIIINNIERFNIPFDETYNHICSEIGMYPYAIDIQPDIICLEKECDKVGNLTNIKKLINKNKLIPNKTCIVNACSHRNNLQTIKFLVSKGAQIDLDCLERFIGTTYIRPLMYVFDEYKKNRLTNKEPEEKEPEEKEPEEKEPEEKEPEEKEPEEKEPEKKEPEKKEPEKKEPEKKEPEKKQFISNIPKEFKAYDKIYPYIPPNLCKILKIKKTMFDINYVEFRRIIMDYLNKHDMIDDKKGTIDAIEPFLYNGLNKIHLVDINEWIYGLLCFKKDIKMIDDDNNIRIRKKNSRVSKISDNYDIDDMKKHKISDNDDIDDMKKDKTNNKYDKKIVKVSKTKKSNEKKTTKKLKVVKKKKE